jgi:hypothetical protein
VRRRLSRAFSSDSLPGTSSGLDFGSREEKHVKTKDQHDPEKRVPVFRKIMLKQ